MEWLLAVDLFSHVIQAPLPGGSLSEKVRDAWVVYFTDFGLT